MEQFSFSFPTLSSERLILRKLEVGDAYDMFQYASKPETSRFADWNPHTGIEYTKDFLRWIRWQYLFKKVKTWGIVLKSENKLIGTVSFPNFDAVTCCAEIGYTLSSDYWGNGYAQEAVKTLLEFGFNKMGLVRIYAKVVSENERSKNLLKKLGFSPEGTHRSSMIIHSKRVDVDYFSILRDEFLAD